jgi:hypothetical protein
MAYIGRDTDKISNVEVLDNITFDGSSSYTLQKGGSNFTPSSANTLLVSINGVVQAGNFTVSGSTIDFGTAVAGTSTCDFILHYGTGLITTPADGTVTTAKLADSSVSLAKLTATGTKDATTFLRGDNTFAEPGGGIEMADQWRLTANVTLTDPEQFVTSNWERNDNSGYGGIGTGMTESSGVFSFPSTGIYLIEAEGSFYQDSGSANFNGFSIHSTIDNSSYIAQTTNLASAENTSDHSNVSSTFLFDVTDISNCKIKFGKFGTNGLLRGNTSSNRTHVTFIRLGDT